MPYREEVEEAVVIAAADMRRLEPGAMAALRRMTAQDPAPAFWKLAVRHPVMTRRRPAWVEILRILAILTPRGAPETRPRLHDGARPHAKLGAALCDGGLRAWPGGRPLVSERRLAQLLAARGQARTEALVRIARMLAGSRDTAAGLDVRSIAWAVLHPENTTGLAEAYYRRLDHVGEGTTEETTE
jgi:CRISPR system Cascade subunit CasB